MNEAMSRVVRRCRENGWRALTSGAKNCWQYTDGRRRISVSFTATCTWTDAPPKPGLTRGQRLDLRRWDTATFAERIDELFPVEKARATT